MGIQPFQSVLDINEEIKTYWEEQYGSPPYGHAEESSLQSFSRRIGVDPKKAIAVLKEKGIKVENENQTLLAIAEQNDIPPKTIYDAIKPKGDTATGKSVTNTKISSMGRRTLKELADMNKIHLETSLLFLKKEGFDATPQSRMREAADSLGKTPYEVFDTLQNLE